MKTIELMEAIGLVGDDIIMETFMDSYGNTKKHSGTNSRKLLKIILIAAIIAVLMAGAAYAVGYTIHQLRLEKLNETFKIEENNVAGYVEYEETSPITADIGEEGQPGIKIISAIRDSQFQRVYLSVSPVSEDEARRAVFGNLELAFTFAASNNEDMEAAFYTCSAGRESPLDVYKGLAQPVYIPGPDEEQHMIELEGQYILDPDYRRQKSFEASYDAQTQSLMLECSIITNSELFSIDFSQPIYIAVKCLELSSVNMAEGTSAEEYAANYSPIYIGSYGTALVETAETDSVYFDFEEGVSVIEPETGEECRVLSVKVLPTGAEWRLTRDDIELLYERMDGDGEDFKAAYKEFVVWLNFYDRLLRESYLNLNDGSRFYFVPANGCPYEDGIETLCSRWDSTIDISKIERICIMGQTRSLHQP